MVGISDYATALSIDDNSQIFRLKNVFI
jgi:hypothetical protein